MGTFKKRAAGLILAFLSSIAWGEVAQTIGPLGGLNNADSPIAISASQAQDLLNVDITPGGKSVKKRKGYGLEFNLAITTSAVHGVYEFYDASGNDVQLAFHDKFAQASVGGAALTTLFSTGTLAATWQCVDSLGFAYCASTARDLIIKTNGVTYSQLSAAPQGTIVAVTPERLLVAGTAANPQRINFSKANDYTTWTVASQPTDPNFEDINAPGSRITHLTYAFGEIIWFKDSSFGAILGTDNTNWQIVTISPTIGTLDNTSVYRDGILYFRGQDGHIYGFDGSTPHKLTRDISGTITTSGSRRSNSWSLSTSSDFGAGSTSSTTVTTSGVIISTSDTNVSNNSFESDGVWTFGSQWVKSTGGYPKAFTNCTVSSAKDGSSVAEYTGTSGSGFTVTAKLVDANSSTVLSSVTFSYANSSCSWTARTIPATSSSLKTLAYIQLVSSENSARTLTSANFAYSGNSVTFYSVSDALFGSQVLDVDYFLGGVTDLLTGIYYSPVHNAASLTSWDTFNATVQNNGGTHAFSMRSSTNSFTTLSSTPTWSSITNNAVISISTGTYFQWKDTFTVTVASQTPTLQNATVNWFEGTASDKAYAIYHDNAIWFSVASGAGASTNNYVLRYDLINQLWTLYDIPVNGFLVRNQSLYFGSASAGKLFKFGDATNDNGSAINAYWKSKDFFGDSPFTDKEFRTLSVSADTVANSSMTVTYTVNGSSSSAYTINLYDANNSYIKNNKNLPLGRNGSTFNVMVGNNAADQPFEVFGMQFTFEPKPWRPTQ